MALLYGYLTFLVLLMLFSFWMDERAALTAALAHPPQDGRKGEEG